MPEKTSTSVLTPQGTVATEPPQRIKDNPVVIRTLQGLSRKQASIHWPAGMHVAAAPAPIQGGDGGAPAPADAVRARAGTAPVPGTAGATADARPHDTARPSGADRRTGATAAVGVATGDTAAEGMQPAWMHPMLSGKQHLCQLQSDILLSTPRFVPCLTQRKTQTRARCGQPFWVACALEREDRLYNSKGLYPTNLLHKHKTDTPAGCTVMLWNLAPYPRTSVLSLQVTPQAASPTQDTPHRGPAPVRCRPQLCHLREGGTPTPPPSLFSCWGTVVHAAYLKENNTWKQPAALSGSVCEGLQEGRWS